MFAVVSCSQPWTGDTQQIKPSKRIESAKEGRVVLEAIDLIMLGTNY
jgi:hypothetical protein